MRSQRVESLRDRVRVHVLVFDHLIVDVITVSVLSRFLGGLFLTVVPLSDSLR